MNDQNEKLGILGRNKDKNLTRKRIRKEGAKSALGKLLESAKAGILDSIPLLRSTKVAIESHMAGAGNIPWVRVIFAICGVAMWIGALYMFAKGYFTFEQMLEVIQTTK